MLKRIIFESSISIISAFVGKIVYDCTCRPDGYLYLDKDTKSVYAVLKKDPDKYKDKSRLIFIFKK